MFSNFVIICILSIICVMFSFLLFYIKRKSNKNQLHKVFMVMFVFFICWMLGLISQLLFSERLNINPIYFDYFIYIFACSIPVLFFIISLTFANTKFKIKLPAMLLFVIPILSLLLLWTNDGHHLFYEVYSTNINETVYGSYFYVYYIYTYLLYGLGIFTFLKYSIKNSGFFSKQAILIITGSLIPIILNLLGVLGVIAISIYLTPISFAIGVIFYFLAIFKFSFLSIAPIALQKIVDRMSDSYIVINENNKITDFNQTLLSIFSRKNNDIRNKDLFDTLQMFNASDDFIKKLMISLSEVRGNSSTTKIECSFDSLNKYFNIEVSGIVAKGSFLGTLILLKDITQHTLDMQTIRQNQETLIGQERLASLGQMIGRYRSQFKNSNNVNLWSS